MCQFTSLLTEQFDFYAFLNLLDTFVTRASHVFARILLLSLIQNFIL